MGLDALGNQIALKIRKWGGRRKRLSDAVGQGLLRDDLRVVAEGVRGNAARLDRLEGRR